MERARVERAWRELQALDLLDLIRRVTDVPSPVGRERPLAEMLAAELEAGGLRASLLDHSPDSASAVGTLPGAGDGPTLLLYSPIDAAWQGGPEDEAVTGPAGARLSVPAALRDGLVLGISAENPKAYAAAVAAAGMALVRAGLELPGTLVIGLGAGGMPVGPGPRPGTSEVPGRIGHGVGAEAIVSSVAPNHAIVAKPGNAVAHEEVGLCVFEVTVRGTFGYTGVRHMLPYRNPIVDAADVIRDLEAWLPDYAREQTSGLVAPQGAVGAIRAGWPDAPAFTPSTCTFWVDLRLSPRTPVHVAEAAFGAEVGRIAERIGADVHVETEVAIPGTSTPEDAWIVRSGVRAWEMVHGRPHEPRRGTSGATDANVIRAMGVPTARIGMSPSAVPENLGGFSMGVADPSAAETLARILCAVAIDTCSQRSAESA